MNRIAPRLAAAVTPETLPIFTGATAREIKTARQHFQTIIVPPGTTVIEQGAQDRAVLYVLRGKLGIWTDNIEVDRSGPGELLGEVALFDQRPRSATVVAIDESELMVLSRASYEALWQDGNEVAYQIERRALELMADRLRRLDFIISQLAEGRPSPYVKPSVSLLQKIQVLFAGKPTPSAPQHTLVLDPLAVLSGTSLFVGVPENDLRVIASWFEQVTASKGDFLCTQGEPGDTLYVLGAGSVDVVVSVQTNGEEHVKTLAHLQAGEMFGLTSLIDSRPRGASCVACEPVTLFALHRQQWRTCFALSSRAASALRCAIVRAFSDQLRDAQQHVLSLDGTAKINLESLMQGSARMEITRGPSASP